MTMNVVLRKQMMVFMFEEIVGCLSALKTVLSNIVKLLHRFYGADYGRNRHWKELNPGSIHKGSQRAGNALLPSIARAVSSLIASELFGHEKGHFTGALQQGRGVLSWHTPARFFWTKSAQLPRKLRLHCFECSRAPI